MPVTREDIISAVNRETENIPRLGSGSAEADGVLGAFLVAPHGYSIVDDDTFTVYINGSSTANYTMDFESGVCTMTSIPTEGQTISFLYHYNYWTDELVLDAINAAINNLYPSFYRIADYDITTDGEAYEYDLPSGMESVCSVKHRATTDDPWSRYTRQKRFQLEQDYKNYYLRFYSAPPEGYIRVSGIYRPQEFTDTVYVTKTIDDISVADPTVIQTTGAHGFSAGDLVYITNVSTSEDVSGWQEVDAVSDTTHFSLDLNVATVTDEAGSVVKYESLGTTCKVPDRAKFPIVSYAAFYLTSQKTLPKARNDVAVVTQGKGVLSPRQMNDISQGAMLRYQVQMQQMRMRPWREN